MNILEKIAKKTKERIEEKKKVLPFEEIRIKAESINKNTGFPFEKSLKKEELSFICEIKKASPSKGIIAEDFPYKEIAKEYEKAGAAAISCLTEPFWFLGNDIYLEEISKIVSIPILRKDFTVDPYMIYEAKLMGASAILLICAILNDKELKEYQDIAYSLGLSVLVEAHDEEEVIRAVNSGAKIIGVNNRNLKTFQVNTENSIRLRQLVPKNCIFVSESGIKTFEDVSRLHKNGTDAVLIGETLMLSENKKTALDKLRGV